MFDLSNDSMHKWLQFVPNLTGCYLVSNKGRREEDNSQNTHSIFESSIESRIPERIHYVVSHTIDTNSATSTYGKVYHKHKLLIDNCASSVELESSYRVMRPAHVCLWPNSPTKIDIYKMSSKYTKVPTFDNMYSDIGHVEFYTDGFKKGDRNEFDYNEGVQSMYVVVNPDHTSTSRRFLVPRDTSYNGFTELFGDGKTFNDGSYNMLFNDGVNKESRKITITNTNFTASSATQKTTINYGEPFQNKMSGVVSLGEIFTVTCKGRLDINNPETASIGTSVTICSEAESIINDALESNDIVFTQSTIDYPYFTGPHVQGADLYNLGVYLSGLKNKELHVDKDKIKIISNLDPFRYTDLEINENDSDIQISSISKKKSEFDKYNEIIVYGLSHKSIKRNVKDIKRNGKKTLEEQDNNLGTQFEVDKRAQDLLKLYSLTKDKIDIECTSTNLELIKSGDIITIDYPSEHIPRGQYIILQIHYLSTGQLRLECGAYSKLLDSHLAELIIENKKINASLRRKSFKELSVDNFNYDTLNVKSRKLTVTRQTQLGDTEMETLTPMGLSTTLNIGNLDIEVLAEDDFI